MPESERTAWVEGVAFYAPYSKRNLIVYDELIAIKEALRTAEKRTDLAGLPIKSEVRTTLERLMPIYRKHWWPAQGPEIRSVTRATADRWLVAPL